jgi:1-aminocyclopropane-1-carboxylate deaminase/D-cysteine desulfhydrase-like pyridoxal-dependent ACC family enzyme
MTAQPALARVPLAVLPTPLQRVRRLERALGSPPLYFKRDDLIGFGLAGTKARGLEYLVGDACRRGCDVLVAGGGPGSSHLAAAAAAARVAGLDCVAVLYGTSGRAHVNLALLAESGAEVRYTGDNDRASVDAAVPAVAAELARRGRHPYQLPRGGATPVGVAGTALAVTELAYQLDAAGVAPALLLLATGSAGTQAGLVAGTTAGGHSWRIVGASVSRSVAECVDRIRRLAAGCTELLAWPPVDPGAIEVRDARGPGFGLASPESREAARLAAAREGVLVDHVYTAKALAELPGLLKEGVGGPVVFWHTGGTPAVCTDLLGRLAAGEWEVRR